MIIRLITLSFIVLIFCISCENKNEKNYNESKNIDETQAIENERIKYQHDIESINREIDSLAITKSKIRESTDFGEAELFRILKIAHFDHIIIGSNNLNEAKLLFEEKFGFSIKNGRDHENGITNFFIEFSDNSEIEIMSIENPSDKISREYKTLLENNNYGFQIALRTNEISNLQQNLTALSFGFDNFSEKRNYSTLSTKSIDTELPLFFIQYNNENNNTIVNHPNTAKGIKSVWFETKDIKKSAKQLVDFGFEPIGNYVIPTFKNKLVEFRNNNFGIVLIESEKYKISGMTILVDSLKEIKNIFNENKSVFDEGSNKNIFLKPSQTKSIWIEFTNN